MRGQSYRQLVVLEAACIRRVFSWYRGSIGKAHPDEKERCRLLFVEAAADS